MEERITAISHMSPVVIFAFNRPDHLERCLESLRNNKESEHTVFWVFVDGPRNSDDLLKKEMIKKLLNKYEKMMKLKVKYSESNLGLEKSVINGLNEIFLLSERAIIMEDDLVASTFFLEYCNAGLNRYQFDNRVASIHGFSYKFKRPEEQPYFLKGADCWGWATWRDRWEYFEEDSAKLINQLLGKRLKKKFDLDGAFPYFKMLIRQSRGEVNSWAIRWHASMFLADKLTLYPDRTLINNNGMDGSGTNAGKSKSLNSPLAITSINLSGVQVKESSKARRKLKVFLRNHYLIRYKASPIRLILAAKRRLSKLYFE